MKANDDDDPVARPRRLPIPHSTINGVALYHEEGGTGAPLVFVHGGFASAASRRDPPIPLDWSWEHDFARVFRFVWYDRRGCYRSSPADGYDLGTQAADLAALLDHLGIPSAHLIGSSAGGPIAVTFATTHPNRTRSLVLVGTGLNLFPLGDPASDTARSPLAVLRAQGPEAAFDRRPPGVEDTIDPLWEREEAEARGNLTAWLAHQQALADQAARRPRAERIANLAEALRAVGAYVDIDLRPAAARVAAPTLVLHGADDQVSPPAWGETLAAAIPGARLRVFPGAGHGLLFRGSASAAARAAAIAFATEVEDG